MIIFFRTICCFANCARGRFGNLRIWSLVRPCMISKWIFLDTCNLQSRYSSNSMSFSEKIEKPLEIFDFKSTSVIFFHPVYSSLFFRLVTLILHNICHQSWLYKIDWYLVGPWSFDVMLPIRALKHFVMGILTCKISDFKPLESLNCRTLNNYNYKWNNAHGFANKKTWQYQSHTGLHSKCIKGCFFLFCQNACHFLMLLTALQKYGIVGKVPLGLCFCALGLVTLVSRFGNVHVRAKASVSARALRFY